jgi:predicted small lipoprotein YifL
MEARSQQGDRTATRYDSGVMKKSIYLLAMLGFFAACEQKTTTVNPPAEKKESNTTIVNPPSEKKETNTTVVNPPEGNSTTTKEEKTDINVNTSPNP